MKLINNLMGGVQIAALAEGLALAERAGLDMEQVAALLMNGAASGQLVARRFLPSHSSFLPARMATLPRRIVSVSRPIMLWKYAVVRSPPFHQVL